MRGAVRDVDMRMGHAEMRLFSYINAQQLQQSEQSKLQRESLNSARVLQEISSARSSVHVDGADVYEDFSIVLPRRPASPHDYHLALDYTAAKLVESVIQKCKLFQATSSQYQDESQELLTTLIGLNEILQIILGCPSLDRYQDVLVDVILYASKCYAFMEKLCFRALPSISSHGNHKAALKLNEFSCRFFNQTVRVCEDYETSDDNLRGFSPREKRLSFGVTTYTVPLRNVAERLLKKKRVNLALTDLDGKSMYNVEYTFPRSWFSKDDAMNAKIESNDRGFSQTLQAGRVKVEKGSWGWEEAQDTVLITYEDLMVANVAAESGSLLSQVKTHSLSSSSSQALSPKFLNGLKYRTSIQLVGSSRIDPDLKRLFIKGVKDQDHVYYKCFVNASGLEEVLGIYRYQRQPFQPAEGSLHIVGRGNQPGLRHVLVSVFTSLGFCAAA